MPSFLNPGIETAGQPGYPPLPQIDVPFRPDEYAFMNESVDTDVFFSFNGVTDHGILKVATPFSTQGYESIERKVWFRRGAVLGPSGSAVVVTEASTDGT
jgi:hypothetical protein